ncbi:hypothetical protein AAFF_G00073020 [Aldrovandia affinis]|uniref:Integrase zinc-binding domain-containing protein n=1 Tax=Aldrovandia affinis TaxID=143900 RepID=A0AAD7RYN7_9TELE|nr:hypothetical protein AAFF_G00073020 [Aldrovandia affinis]
MAKDSELWSARQQLQLSFISEFTMDIQHATGKDNSVADCISRAVASAVHLGVDYNRIAADQAADPDVQAYRTAVTDLKLVDITFDGAGAALLCGISTGQPRPVVPSGWQRQVFDAIHGLSHPGRKSSLKLVAAKFIVLKKDVHVCVECQ